MNVGGANFQNPQNVRVKGTGSNPGVIRFAGGATSFEGTLTINDSASYTEANRQWALPNKNGVIGLTGTFAVQTEVIAAGYYTTLVNFTGMRREDAFFANIRDCYGTSVTTSTRTYPILISSRPENGYVNLTFYNPTGTSTVYSELVLGYSITR